VDYLDSAGGLALAACEREAARRGVPLTYVNLSPAARGIKDLIDRAELDRAPLIPAQRRQGLVERAGEIGLAVKEDVYQVVSFLGDFLEASLRAARHPKLLRWGEVLIYMEKVGVDGLGIVALISFLLGLIMAFMSSLQLQPFGANIYVANLVAVAMVKELGPIMTAILVAGRSGSAFAAEIGTMKVNEEVDALLVMGYDPLVFLALPKVLAAVLTVPLLTLFADLVAILGGLTVGVVGMGFTVQAYVQQTLKTLYATDILTGCLKAAVFAVLIAGIGCQRGFKVRGGAESVGTQTTSAVVSAMFLIIVADSIFAVVLHYV
jgi:phospholipid/cholesterol/gamma-HCH transport system permease protein